MAKVWNLLISSKFSLALRYSVRLRPSVQIGLTSSLVGCAALFSSPALMPHSLRVLSVLLRSCFGQVVWRAPSTAFGRSSDGLASYGPVGAVKTSAIMSSVGAKMANAILKAHTVVHTLASLT